MRIVFITIVFVAFALTSCGNKTTLRSAVPNQTLAASEQLPIDTEKQTDELATTGRLAIRYFGVGLEETGYRVTWSYFNPGDYNLDGIVAVDDITPLVQHWGDGSNYWDWLDTSNDGLKNTADLTALAMYSNTQITGYRIEGAATTDGPWEELVTVDTGQMEVTDSTVSFNAQVPLGSTYLRIVTETSGGDAGVSEPQVVPSKEPKIYSVTPTVAYVNEPVVFSALVTGAYPNYIWDIGGGELLDTTLGRWTVKAQYAFPGDYHCLLTAYNDDGRITFPFTVTVYVRPSWAHTLGVDELEVNQVATCTDGNGMIWTLSGYQSDHLFLDGGSPIMVTQWSPEGNLIGVKEWVGPISQYPSDIVGLPQGGVVVLGHALNDGGGQGILLLSYDSSLNLLWSRIWITRENVDTVAMTRSYTGDIIVTANHHGIFEYSGVLTAYFNSQGNLNWARRWISKETEYEAQDAQVTPTGEIYSVASCGLYYGVNIAILHYDSTGRLIRATTSINDTYVTPFSSVILGDSLFVAGGWYSNGASRLDGVIWKTGLNSTAEDPCEYVVVGNHSFEKLEGIYTRPSGKLLAIGISNEDYETYRYGSESSFIMELTPDFSDQLMWSYATPDAWMIDGTMNEEGDFYSMFKLINSSPAWERWDYGYNRWYDMLTVAEGVHEPIVGSEEEIVGEDSIVQVALDEGVYGKSNLRIMRNFPSL